MTQEQVPLMDVERVLSILSKISIFAGLNESQLHTLFRQLKEVTYPPAEIIFRQGDQPSDIYIVLSGRVKLYVEQDDTTLELFEFDEGHCFGETSVIGIQPHAASAVATVETRLIVLSRTALMRLSQKHLPLFNVLILNVAREACRRLHRTDEILMHYVHNSLHSQANEKTGSSGTGQGESPKNWD